MVGLTKVAAHLMLLYGIYRVGILNLFQFSIIITLKIILQEEVPVLVKAWLIIFTLHELVYVFSVIVMWDIWFNLFFKLNIALNIIFFSCVFSYYLEIVD